MSKELKTIEEKAKFYDEIMATSRCHDMFTFDKKTGRQYSAALFIDDGYPSECIANMLLHVIETEIGKEDFQQFISDRVF